VKDFNKALNYSFLLLKYRARSRSEIISRLKQKGYNPSTRKQILNYLEENNYINDEDFVRLFVSNSLEKGWGPIKIDFNLKKLGISSQLRKHALGGDFAYGDMVREIIHKKLEHYKVRRPSLSAENTWQKIVMHLARKGFDYKVINQEMSNLGVSSFENK
tara:strand:- start:77 stop:556 length:480 start_codon:yes stop_codon:yes gene_type:complete